MASSDNISETIESENELKICKEDITVANKENNISLTMLKDIDELTQIVWGNQIKDDVFERWSQGFIFDTKEPTALIQLNGGPCAIIAPVQGFLIKELLSCTKCKDNLRDIDGEEIHTHLANSFLSILLNVCTDSKDIFLVIYETENEHNLSESLNDNSQSNDTSENEKEKKENDENKSDLNNTNSHAKRIKLDHSAFKNKLKVFKCDSLTELKPILYKYIKEFKKNYGVLCFLYSIFLTKGLNKLKTELEESGEPLIDRIHGHGSQSLINLMLCGIATSNVFDGDKCLEGLKLQGIPKQSTIGFLTIMEYNRYCEVGWYLKNPKNPIWILASETHLTVFFSKELSLIQNDESPRQNAIKKFSNYDPGDNGFVKTEDLQNLMESLDLFSEKEYVDIVKQKLDSENLGIITQTAFLNEYYPLSNVNSLPETFLVYHYNGLSRSNQNNEVEYVTGEAKIIDFTDQPSLDLNSIKNCLQTKWPTMEVKWLNGKAPSLN